MSRIRALLGRWRRPAPRPAARPLPPWMDDAPRDPWARTAPAAGRWCRICGWTGEAFDGVAHCESATCPTCGSIARDRFLFHCFVATTPRPTQRLRVLETSPRLDERYRHAMAGWFDYLSSDFDERAHRGAIRVDLQAIDLPDASLDVVLTPHVLEHVPDTDRALAELHRVLAPGGVVLLQVPLLQAATAPPAEPEFHGDDTPVFWRFGWDLTDRLRDHGFEVSVLVPQALAEAAGAGWPGPSSPEFDADAIARAADPAALTVVADAAASRQQGFEPGYQFVTWRASRPR